VLAKILSNTYSSGYWGSIAIGGNVRAKKYPAKEGYPYKVVVD
jgi:hypothetical protein